MKNSIVDLLEAYPIPEQKEVPPYQIYCDMDGVLTNFEERFDHFSGMHPQEYEKKIWTRTILALNRSEDRSKILGRYGLDA